MKYWFTSDYHLNHANIIKYCNRDLFMNNNEKLIMENGSVDEVNKLKISRGSLDKMNATIIRNHNMRVKEEDIVFHIGDFCFKNTSGGKEGEGGGVSAQEWESQLNGKIIYIRGNHDRNNSTKTIIQGLLVNYCNHDIYLVHKPEHYNSNYKINFVGHVHEKWRTKKIDSTILFNVGVDVNKFMPITFQEALKGVKL